MKNYIIEFIRIKKLVFVFLFVLSLIVTALSLASPLLSANLIDELIDGNFRESYFIVFWIGIVSLSDIFTTYIMELSKVKLNNKLSYFIEEKLLTNIIESKYKELNRRKVDVVSQNIISDSFNIAEFIVENFSSVITNFMVLIGFIIILYSLNPIFIFVSIGSIPIYIILVVVVQKRMNARILKAKNKRDEFNANFIEQVSLSIVTKVYNLFNESIRRMKKYFDEKYNSRLKEFKIIYAFYSVEGLITMLVQIVFFGFGVSFISNRTMTIGEFSITLTIYAHIVRSIQYYLQLISKTEDFKVSYTRLNDLVNIQREENNGEIIIDEIEEISIFPITLEIDDAITLSYPKINMSIGDIIELSGDNGSGKTSFINILLGIYEVQRNKVFYNENSIEDIDLNVLRKANVSYLMQDSLFLNDTVINNLDYFLREKRTPSEYIKLIKDKRLYFLLENYIGSENPGQFFDRNIMSLSGGQRQKIALLTVLLKDYNLLILDEPLKGQDKKSKKMLYQYLQSIQRDKIILLVDHGSLFSTLCNKKIELTS